MGKRAGKSSSDTIAAASGKLQRLTPGITVDMGQEGRMTERGKGDEVSKPRVTWIRKAPQEPRKEPSLMDWIRAGAAAKGENGIDG